MDVKEIRYNIDMFGNTVIEEIDVHYFYDEWADFDD